MIAAAVAAAAPSQTPLAPALSLPVVAPGAAATAVGVGARAAGVSAGAAAAATMAAAAAAAMFPPRPLALPTASGLAVPTGTDNGSAVLPLVVPAATELFRFHQPSLAAAIVPPGLPGAGIAGLREEGSAAATAATAGIPAVLPPVAPAVPPSSSHHQGDAALQQQQQQQQQQGMGAGAGVQIQLQVQQQNLQEPQPQPPPQQQQSVGSEGGGAEAKVATGEKRPWTEEENELLRAAVATHSNRQWKKIALCVPGRTAVQCLQHYNHVLDPAITRGSWSPEEVLPLYSCTPAVCF